MPETSKIYFSTQILMLAALFLTLKLKLLSALLAGFFTFQIVIFGARLLGRAGIIPTTGKIILFVFISLLVIALFALGAAAAASQITDGPESLVALLQRVADVVDSSRSYFPLWAQHYLPGNIGEWQIAASNWLRENARHLSVVGQEAGVLVVHIIIGMIIGGLVALNPSIPQDGRPLAQGLYERIVFLSRAFRRIVFSQIRISALNTLLTAIFLLIALPLSGNALPLAKTLVAVTFIVGLLPIVGNLISNALIFAISLGVSPAAAIAALVYLILIHKLEYFVNAHVIGSKIHARAWEILLVMLVMESAFGMAGLVAGPIYYAYIKDELYNRQLI